MRALAVGGAVALALLLALPRVGVAYRPVLLAIIIALIGAGIAKYRTETVAAPALNFRYYGPIEGRVVNIDRSASDALRLTLDRVVLDRIAPHRTPARVRVSVHGDQPFSDYRPGTVLMMTGHLSPPRRPGRTGWFRFPASRVVSGAGGGRLHPQSGVALGRACGSRCHDADFRAAHGDFTRRTRGDAGRSGGLCRRFDDR